MYCEKYICKKCGWTGDSNEVEEYENEEVSKGITIPLIRCPVCGGDVEETYN